MDNRVLGTALLTIMGASAMASVPNDKTSDAEPEDPREFRQPVLPPPVQIDGTRGAGTSWVSLGPAPTQSAQVDVPPDNEVSGAIQSFAIQPGSSDVIYAATVNGGIWKTTNATAARPTWVPQTDALPSQSMGDIAFDRSDTSFQTLIAGIGRFSNFGRRGDDELGVYYTQNGGASWTLLGGSTLLGQRIFAVAANGPIFVVGSTSAMFRSTDRGLSWSNISGTNGLTTGAVFDMVEDPTSTQRLYAVTGERRVHRSDDFGASWSDITANAPAFGTTTTSARLAVAANGDVYLAVINSSRIAALARYSQMSSSWTALDVPSVHPGGQGTLNTSLVAHPSDADLVYLAGDRITVSPFTGSVFLVRSNSPLGSQATSIVDGGANSTAPHADSRSMAFDAAGNLLQSDDGGLYRRTNPTSTTGVWQSVIGNLSVMEVHDLDHDKVSNIIAIGTQDNGTHEQISPSDLRWRWVNSGDGGDVAIDDTTQAGASSFRFYSSQNLGSRTRRQMSPLNVLLGGATYPSIPDPQFVTPQELNVTDQSRMLVGGTTNIYEITGANTTPALTTLGGTGGANRNAMAFGASDDATAAYVGTGAAVRRRSAGGAFVATAALPAGANTVTDVAIDPANSSIAYAVDDDQIFFTNDGGSSWSDVSGNIGAVSSFDFRTIEVLKGLGPDRVALGTRSGVYIATIGGSVWTRLGNALPDVLVFDLRYDPDSRTLYAGTLGRGVWSYVFSLDPIFANGFE